MSFSRTRPVAPQHHRHGASSGDGGGGVFHGFRSDSFPNWTGGDVNGSKHVVNGGNFAFVGGYGCELPSGRQPQRRHAPLDDFVAGPPMKRRRSAWEGADGRGGCWRSGSGAGACGDAPSTSDSSFLRQVVAAARYSAGIQSIPSDVAVPSTRVQVALEEDDTLLMSRDEIERCSPSRKDGIDLVRETHLRYTYCAFLQNLGMRLDLPQTTIGTAMVLCHRFFVRRSHACHDRFLIATAALFLAAKSEETPCPLNTVLRASCEISHKQDPAFFSFLLPVDWFEQYRERVVEAEQMILTTLNFELNVQHPYTPLTSVLDKLGLSQTVLVDLAWNLINEGLKSSLWLQFKPHHIAAGAAFLAAKFLNFDLACYQSIWQEFQTTPPILQDVVHQLMELF